MRDTNLPAIGSTYAGCEVLPGSFGPLPLGKILRGPNKGVTIIINSFPVTGTHR